MTVGRFAPSPTGSLHLGNLRTALLAWCFARHVDGRFAMRVEDLTTGAAPVREAEQLADLAAIGIDHDGPIVRQSERVDRYAAAIDMLVAQGRTYPCTCSRRDIREAAAAPHGPSIEGGYPGTCAARPAAEQRRLLDSGEPVALRLRAEGATVEVDDRLLGPIGSPVDDFVIRRADGTAAYNLAVVLDDADANVDQVVRGDDLVHTTPRQVLVQQLLGLPTPEYVHVPLVYGPDGDRLAKRHGAISLGAQLERGETVPHVVGRLAASIGLAGPDEEVDAREVLDRFDPVRLRIDEQLPS